MSVSLKTNISALRGRRSLRQSNVQTSRSLRNMSSGKRINSAADDAAGLSISTKQKASIVSSGQALRNVNDGVSTAQMAEGALNELSNMLIRMRELSVQGATDTVSPTQKSLINKEYQQLKSEVQRIGKTTKINNKPLLDGSILDFDIQAGINNTSFDRLKISSADHVMSENALGIINSKTASKISSLKSMDRIDYAINQISRARAYWGSVQNRMTHSANNLEINTQNVSASKSKRMDTDYAQETANLVRNKLINTMSTKVVKEATESQRSLLKLIG